MVQFKEKKKKSYNRRNKGEKTTIDSKHNKMLDEFNNTRKNIPNKKNELNKIINELSLLNSGSLYELSDEKLNHKLNLEERRKNIENNIKKTESNSEFNNYLLDTSHLLYQYFDDDTSFVNSKRISSNKKSVLDFFDKSVNNNNISNDEKLCKEVTYKNKNDIISKYINQ